ncbi:MAG: hypothetical protein JEZ03_13065 [Bacteroidales bacterium]|nr:hypothetical protein [Bacteroidales bacterium]
MVKKSIKRKKSKVKFRKLALKLSSKQMQALEYHCKLNETSPISFVKELLSEYTVFPKNYMQEIPFPEEYVSENQINLIDMIEDVVQQNEPAYKAEDKKKWATPQKKVFPTDLFS